MTIPTWDASLPQYPVRDGYSRTPRDNVERYGTDIGPEIVRQRFSALIWDVTASLRMSGAQLATFRTFFAANQATPFYWKEWLSGATVQYRFGSGQPKESPLPGGRWRVDLTLVELPS